MTKIDKIIIRTILDHIGSDDKLEEDIAGTLEQCTDGEVSQTEFHEWLETFKI